MNSDILRGKWNQLKGSARSKWGQLTNDDVDRIQGDSEKLLGILQERYGQGREWAEREMNDFLRNSNDSAVPRDSAGDFAGNPDFTGTESREKNRKRRAS